WLRPGQHIDLIGAYRADMREADDTALRRARIFVDSRDTTLNHIGELKTPLEQGVITRDDIIADFYDLPSGRFARRTEDEITLFKNGGGAHLDLMTSRYILKEWGRA
ncbi:MAG: ornithine cyclodeaminase, partial [Pseudomonadota bacterium]|nr:ornithine cyclodeaminase [Pseudomonadota bacterium]